MSDTRDDWTRAIAKLSAPRSKYGARKKAVEGITFDSTKEATRFQALRFREQAGEIRELETQPKFPLYVLNNYGAYIEICTYVADFRYREGEALIVEDVKSPATKTPLYRLKKKMAEAQYGIEIHEV